MKGPCRGGDLEADRRGRGQGDPRAEDEVREALEDGERGQREDERRERNHQEEVADAGAENRLECFNKN